MTALRLLVVDDEPLARLRLSALLADCPDPRCEVVGEAAHTVQALAMLQARACDAVLLDIQMPGQQGTDFAAALRRLPRPPAVVFVTAHADHALQAFELDAVDYLTKPVRRERLQEALQRVVQRLGRSEAAPEVPVLVVSERGRVLRIPVTEVLYLKAELKYVTLRTAERSYLLDDSLTDLEARLPQHFLRVHRNALVARQALRALEKRVIAGGEDEEGAEGWAVQVAPLGEWLSVSRRQVAAVSIPLPRAPSGRGLQHEGRGRPPGGRQGPHVASAVPGLGWRGVVRSEVKEEGRAIGPARGT